MKTSDKGERDERGCEVPLKKPLGIDEKVINGIPGWRFQYDRCLAQYVQAGHNGWFGYYNLFSQGFLLYAGGVGDQPAKYIDVMMTLQSWFKQAEREAIEKVGK